MGKKCLFPIALLPLAFLPGCPGPAANPDAIAGDKSLTSFGFQSPSAEGLIDETAKNVLVDVPNGTDVTRLVAVFVISGTKALVAGAEQASGITENDFTNPLAYEVWAEDGSTRTYTVTVEVGAAQSSGKSFTSFGFAAPAVSGVIDEESKKIQVIVPHGTDLTSLAAVFETTGDRVTVNDMEQESGTSINDFSSPLHYVVYAEDGSSADYLVEVRIAPGSEKELTAFSIQSPPASGVIDQTLKVVRVRLADGVDLSSLVAAFTSTGVSVTLDGAPQESGVTANDFRVAREYVVTAEDGTSAAYLVRVTSGTPIVINEVDYDQVGTDSAEFIELYAFGEADLAGIVIVLINGGVTPAQEYSRIDLASEIGVNAGQYLVVAGPSVSVDPGARKLSPPGWSSSNRIQNGPKDAIVLFDTLGSRIVDAVSYNGTVHGAIISGASGEWDVTEGSLGAPSDSNSAVGSVGRSPDGQDTNQNGTDFRFSPTLTPGAQNQ
jgi:hypothetical protein